MKKNLKNDIIFKTFFSRKGNEAYLVDFLESLLEIKIDKIQIEQEVNLGRMSPNEKTGSLDIQAVLNDGIIANIEMQVVDNHNIVARSTFYAAKQMTKWAPKGGKYENMKKIVMINILDYECLPYENYITKMACVMQNHPEYVMNDKIEWYFIELPKFRRSNPDMDNRLNQWLAVIDDRDEGRIKMAIEKNELLKNVKVEFLELSGEEETRRIEELKDKWERDYNSGVSYAREEGMRKGMEDGLEQGQKNNSLEIAKEMLKNQEEIEKIMKYTKLTKEQIEALKKEVEA